MKTPISFEFFPPKTTDGLKKLTATAKTLNIAKPEFFSVTFGAGGSTTAKTFETVTTLKQTLHADVAPHISGLCHTKKEIKVLLYQYQQEDITRLVVLRGDAPQDTAQQVSGEFRYASELVAFIREHYSDQFHIEVAAYPECHPESTSLKNELQHFKTKVDAGANRAITQYFYNIDAYHYFVEQCQQSGITTPIVPGIMPISGYERLNRFSNLCGAQIPKWLNNKLQSYDDNSPELAKFGQEFIINLCEKLIASGAPGLHFYTLNQSQPSLDIVNALK